MILEVEVTDESKHMVVKDFLDWYLKHQHDEIQEYNDYHEDEDEEYPYDEYYHDENFVLNRERAIKVTEEQLDMIDAIYL